MWRARCKGRGGTGVVAFCSVKNKKYIKKKKKNLQKGLRQQRQCISRWYRRRGGGTDAEALRHWGLRAQEKFSKLKWNVVGMVHAEVTWHKFNIHKLNFANPSIFLHALPFLRRILLGKIFFYIYVSFPLLILISEHSQPSCCVSTCVNDPHVALLWGWHHRFVSLSFFLFFLHCSLLTIHFCPAPCIPVLCPVHPRIRPRPWFLDNPTPDPPGWCVNTLHRCTWPCSEFYLFIYLFFHLLTIYFSATRCSRSPISHAAWSAWPTRAQYTGSPSWAKWRWWQGWCRCCRSLHWSTYPRLRWVSASGPWTAMTCASYDDPFCLECLECMFTWGTPLAQWLTTRPRFVAIEHDGYPHGQVHLGMPKMDNTLLWCTITVTTVMLSCSISISICIKITLNKMVVCCVYLLNCVKLSDYANNSLDIC